MWEVRQPHPMPHPVHHEEKPARLPPDLPPSDQPEVRREEVGIEPVMPVLIPPVGEEARLILAGSRLEVHRSSKRAMIVFPSAISPVVTILRADPGSIGSIPAISPGANDPTFRRPVARNRVIVSFVNPGEV